VGLVGGFYPQSVCTLSLNSNFGANLTHLKCKCRSYDVVSTRSENRKRNDLHVSGTFSSGCHLMQLGIVERYILLLKCHEWIRHRENIVCVHFEVNKIFLCSCDLDGFRYCLYCPTILEEVSWRLVQTTV